MTTNFFLFPQQEFMQGHPRIKGPKSTADRIAIIGAGAAGIHMAYELKVYINYNYYIYILQLLDFPNHNSQIV